MEHVITALIYCLFVFSTIRAARGLGVVPAVDVGLRQYKFRHIVALLAVLVLSIVISIAVTELAAAVFQMPSLLHGFGSGVGTALAFCISFSGKRT